MDVMLLVLMAPLLVLAIWLALVVFAGLGVPGLPPLVRKSATAQEHAVLLAQLHDRDGAHVSPEARTQLLRPQVPALGTVLMWHGLTNCPAQLAEVAEELCARGYFVLLARIPRHGRVDRLSRDLEGLAVEELAGFCAHCIDTVAGLPRPLTVAGFSVGGGLATWAGAVRDEVDRVVAISPMIVPKGFPVWVVRFLVRFPRLVPSAWVWWDPLLKAEAGSPYASPGFPMTGLLPFAHVGVSLHDERVLAGHELQSVTLITNPNDMAVRNGAAEVAIARVFDGRVPEINEIALGSELGWPHDFIDQYGARSGDAADIADLILTAMGERPTARVEALIAQTARLDLGDSGR